VPKKKKPAKTTRPSWAWSDGWRVAAWAALCAEAILAGGDRPCMPSFKFETLLSDILAMHAVGVAEGLGLCAAIPAFIVAANPRPSGLNPNRRTTAIIAIIVATLMLQLFFGSNPFLWIPVLGVAIGLLIRWYPWVRSNWIVVGLITAVALGVIQFSGLQYSHNKCWP
jgi:hypothetical protein